MGLTNAERQRRYRERRRAEQQNAAAAVTKAVTHSVTGNAVTPVLSERGRRLWQQLADEGPELKPAERVLAEEACRTTDRLDVLDRILRGDEDAWMRLHSANEDGSIVKVVLNNALAEARQQQVALKALLAELRTSRQGPAAKSGAGKPPASGEQDREVPAGVLDLTKRIGDLQRQAGGSAAG
ncbi:hypothetical protein ACPB67_02585 [Micromonospora taraxaci]|uniref:hypothetical protein n=1 Tax=Micromonospora taraxaci TaxID=1316803 RepID=UPI003C2F4221